MATQGIRPGDRVSWRVGEHRRQFGKVYTVIKQGRSVIGFRAFDENGMPKVLLAYQVTKECD
jgi:hypothetical protein